MKKIGFIDYYLSEWHANNYVGWIKELCGEMKLDYTVAYAWAELDTSPKDGVSTAEWCEKYGVTQCGSIEELCEVSDVIVILAPSNPDKHLSYARVALTYKKRTYIDKTFAPDHTTAVEIFEIAKKYNTPFFSSSALRYAEELDAVGQPTHMITTGGGISIDEYIIHQAEMAIKKLGTDIISVSAKKNGTQTVFDVKFGDGRSAVMLYGVKFFFSAYMSDEGGNEAYKQISSPFFMNLIRDMLRFFETGETSFDTNETKAVIKLVEMSIKAASQPGTVIGG